MNLNIKKYLVQKAQEINIEPRLLLALAVLEAKSKGLHAQDIPVILFERHIFYRLLKKQGFDVDKLSLKSPTLINKTPGGYLGGLKENERLRQACAINAELAYQSASYGLFQIMGFHALALGYQSGQYFAKQMGQSELNQCDAFIRFLSSINVLADEVLKVEWEFRLYYNPDYYAEGVLKLNGNAGDEYGYKIKPIHCPYYFV